MKKLVPAVVIGKGGGIINIYYNETVLYFSQAAFPFVIIYEVGFEK